MPRPLTYLKSIKEGKDPALFATQGCLHPYQIGIRDSFGLSRNLVCDCGRCVNCRDQKRNEWVSRMILHSYSTPGYVSPWKYCYFVTLTYGTYCLYGYKSHPFLADWHASYPTQDCDNARHVPAWGPSIIVPQHVTKFLKRLRISVPDTKISYCRCSEYGEHFGRPHHHLILWSDKPLSQSLVSSAWGYKISLASTPTEAIPYRGSDDHKYSFFSIGRVHMVDLGANGSLNDKLPEGAQASCDAAHNFAYVAKYVNKYDVDYCDAAIKRFLKVFHNLPFTDSSSGSELRTLDYQQIYSEITYENLNFTEFKRIISPSFSSSTSYSIGKGYALSSLSRFDSGNFALPTWRGKPLVFPKFFNHLLSLRNYPLRFEKLNMSGRSLVKSDSFVVRKLLLQLRDAKIPISDLLPYNSFKECFQGSPLNVAGDFENIFEFVFHSPDGVARSFYDLKRDQFFWYRFNRTLKRYDLYQVTDREDTCDMIISIIDKSYDRNLQATINFEAANELYNVMEGTRKVIPILPSVEYSLPAFCAPYEVDIPDDIMNIRYTYLQGRAKKSIEYKYRHKSLG